MALISPSSHYYAQNTLCEGDAGELLAPPWASLPRNSTFVTLEETDFDQVRTAKCARLKRATHLRM